MRHPTWGEVAQSMVLFIMLFGILVLVCVIIYFVTPRDHTQPLNPDPTTTTQPLPTIP